MADPTPPKLTLNRTLKLLMAWGLLTGLLAGCQLPIARFNNPSSNIPIPGPGNDGNGTPPNFIADVVEKVGPAIVSIDTTRSQASNNSFLPQSESPEFTQGKGSGFILSADGKILTNAHVVEGSSAVMVTLPDGRQFPGNVLGADPLTDIAVIQIEANDLPTVKLGNSDQLVVGQWAIAIGNPLGLSNTVTAGIISATGRSSDQIGAADQRVSYIQTDAAINPGNSGGPLLNQDGAVVGVNTAIIQRAQGLGFAIPINTAKRIAEQIVQTGQARHLFLGIRMLNLTPEVQAAINQENPAWQLKQSQGVVVIAVMEDSPAAAAGIQPGDWIAKINNQAQPNARQIQEQVEATPENGQVRLAIQRQGQELMISVTPQAMPTN